MPTLFNHIGAALAGLAALTALAVAGPARAQTISNTASIEWQVGDARVSRPSNRVDLEVDRGAPIVTTWVLGGRPGGMRMPVSPTVCRGSAGDTPITLDGAFADLANEAAAVEQRTKLRAGQPLIISVVSSQDNLSATAIDLLPVTLTTPAGDSETIVLNETAVYSGQFTGVTQTVAVSLPVVKANCILSLVAGETLLTVGRVGGPALGSVALELLIDPFGVVFDSGDGAPVSGTRVTLIDADTGTPAIVFGDDAVSRYPSTVVSGTPVTDASGAIYTFPPGHYRFPFVKAGRYRLLVAAPAPYVAPSKSTPAELATLSRVDGRPFIINAGSYGSVFVLSDPAPVQIDIPLDRPGAPLLLRTTASVQVAVPGDGVQYRITVGNGDATRSTGVITISDLLPPQLRLVANTVSVDGDITAYTVSGDGLGLSIALPPLAGGKSMTVTYLLEVRPDAAPGDTLNRAQVRDSRGSISPVADALVRIARDTLANRLTIIGRVTDGGCTVDPSAARGIAGVRVMLEDGSYAVTDIDGRYHFEGVLPGTHVVQLDPSTLGPDREATDCTANARSAGSAISRFVIGQGGVLVRADFHARTGANGARSAAAAVRAKPVSDPVAAGAGRDWLTGQTPGIAWLFPAPDHKPRTKAIRVAIKHLPGQTVALTIAGKPVNALGFDGTQKSADGQVAVSLWRAIDIDDRTTALAAEIRNADGSVAERLTNTVHYSPSALRAEFVRDRSVLVADGVTRPVIALRLTDRDGRPVHHGVVGDFEVPAPYAAAVEVDAQAARQLAGLERARPVWRVEGDEGLAFIDLEATTASGALSVTLPFRDGEVSRNQRIDLWLDPGDRPWTVVGFGEGTAGFNTLEGRLEGLGADGERWLTDARLALYAKGRVRGKWLLTLAYDSKKNADETRFGGVIDPQAYYTIYADRSERRYDATSVRKLYVKLERPQFYALFGDYTTDFDEAELTRYNRAFNGLKAQYQGARVGATAFVADTPYRHRREEIQGNGLSGPYGLAARDILPNSERIVIETRDRLRSERIAETRVLVRHIDYDIDYVAGTLRFREPVLSRSSLLDPQFIVADYEVDGVAARVVNAGGRATWTPTPTLKVGASVIHDEDDRAKTNVGGLDVRYQPNAATEVRAEVAISEGRRTTNGQPGSGTATAWLIEAEHHGARTDIFAYARQQQAGFGVGQLNASETATRKFGLDGRLRITPALSLVGTAYREDYLDTGARRTAGRASIEYRAKWLDLRAGVLFADDRTADGRAVSSTIAQLGATKRLLNNRLELDASTELALARTTSIDFPARHKLGARFAITRDVTLIGQYEIARGDSIDADTARLGFDIRPWAGARLTASANRQDIAEYGPRSYAAYGLAQSLPLGKHWSVDVTLDGSRTLGGVDPALVLNREQPIASGGVLGRDGTLTEDFTAVTLGATYRGTRWSATGRAEYRAAERGDRYGVTLGALRQLGEGSALGGAASWYRASEKLGPRTEVADLAISWAHRPDDSRFAFLEKLELRSDLVRGAVIGLPGPIGGAPLTVSGDATSRRIVNSLSVNWSPTTRAEGRYLGRSEVAAFWGSRYVFDRIEAEDIGGWSNVVGADLRFDLSRTLDVGVAGTVRESGARAFSFSGGPSLGIAPFKGAYVSLGYNVVGFRDRDYDDARYTRQGPFVTLRFKFDQTSLSGLGLGRK